MIRTLLATTALTALLTTGIYAQEATPATPPATEAPADPAAPAAPAEPAAPDAMAPATDDIDATAVPSTQVREPFDMAAGYMAVDTDNLASRLIDQPVYSTAGEDAEEIGNITDLVFNADGQITAVIIGVGGFLGIGEKSVAVDFSALEFVLAHDNTERWVLPTTADALTAAPDFVWQDDVPTDNLNTEAVTPTDEMAPVDPMAPADPAAAPAN